MSSAETLESYYELAAQERGGMVTMAATRLISWSLHFNV